MWWTASVCSTAFWGNVERNTIHGLLRFSSLNGCSCCFMINNHWFLWPDTLVTCTVHFLDIADVCLFCWKDRLLVLVLFLNQEINSIQRQYLTLLILICAIYVCVECSLRYFHFWSSSFFCAVYEEGTRKNILTSWTDQLCLSSSWQRSY